MINRFTRIIFALLITLGIASIASPADAMRPALDCSEDEIISDGECLHIDAIIQHDAWRFYNRYSIDHPSTYIRLR